MVKETTFKADSTAYFVPPSSNPYGTTNSANVQFTLNTTDTVGQDGNITIEFEALELGVYNGCTNEFILKQGATIVISVPSLTPSMAAIITPSDTTICKGNSATLNANLGSGLSYQWQLNGMSITGAVNSSYIATIGGNYSVVVTETTTGRSTTSYWSSITVNQPPVKPIINGLLSFCQGRSDTLTANSAGCLGCNYTWSPSNQIAPTFIATAGGIYSVTASNGCTPNSTSSQMTLTVNPLPKATFSIESGVNLKADPIPNAKYQWYKYDTLIKGATSRFYTIKSKGYYMVGITDANGCTGFSQDTFLGFLGINKLYLSKQITIYPNPTNGIFSIFPAKEFSNATIKIINSLGQSVLEKSNISGSSISIDILNQPTGVYIIEISDGGNHYRSKIIR